MDLAWSWWVYLMVALVLATGGAWLGGYLGPAGPVGRSRRVLLATLRAALLALVLLMLLDPAIRIEREEPVRGHVAVLLDDSLSMGIEDETGATRGELVRALFDPATGSVAAALAARFETRFYRFAGSTVPLAAGDSLSFSGGLSRLGSALAEVARAEGLAAVILVSDGGAADDREVDDAIRGLEAAGIPAHAIGVGAERFDIDLEIAEVDLPPSVLAGDALGAEVTLVHRGLGGREVTLVAEVDSVVAGERRVVLPTSAERTVVRLAVPFPDAGARRVRFRVDPLPGEQLAENNSARREVQVREEPIRVLHLEQEPRFEVKFLRRAVVDDEQIRLTSLVRTAENKFYRIGVTGSSELAEGFPTDSEALARFDVVILGSVEARLLEAPAQTAIREFVARRGGGLLLLGGRHAFAEGGHRSSELGGLMPVVLPALADPIGAPIDAAVLRSAPEPFRAEVQVRPTPAALDDPILPASPVPGLAGEAVWSPDWARLPPLTVVNPVRAAKPGATVVLEGTDPSGEPLVVLAHHRYGRGAVAALPVANTWRWQMHADLPAGDETHERLWRELLRGLARPVQGRVRLQVSPPRAAPGQQIALELELLDAAYRPRDGATPSARVTTPLGDVETHALSPVAQGGGRYRAFLTPASAGRYEVEVGHEDEPAARALLDVDATGDELRSAELDAGRLRRIAARTGGIYLPAGRASSVLGAIVDTRGTRRLSERLRLAEMPALMTVILALAAGEWWLRRRWRLA